MRRLMMLAGWGVPLTLLAAACSRGTTGTPSSGDRPTATTSTTASTSTVSPPPTTATQPPQPTTSPPEVTPVECTVRDLDVSLGAEEGTAGTIYRALVFTNTGDRTCTIQGFPGVSFVTGDDGRQVGEAATRVGEKGRAVTLKPGETANSAVGFVQIGNFDEAICQPTAVRGLRVYPPHERKAKFVPLETTGCAGDLLGSQLTVRTVRAGSVLG